jgi:hypothetical protein
MLGKVVADSRVVEKMICGMPSHFKQIVLVIDTLLDTFTLIVADLTERLKAAEESLELP